MKVTLQLEPHSYWGMVHVAKDVQEMLEVVRVLEEKGIVSRVPSGHDFTMEVLIEVDGDIDFVWTYQDTTGISGIVDRNLLEYACKKAGINLEIEVEKLTRKE